MAAESIGFAVVERRPLGGRLEEQVVDALGVGLDVTAAAAEELADRGRGLAGHVLEEDVSCSQYAAAVSPLARQAATCFFHVAASAIPCTLHRSAGHAQDGFVQRARRVAREKAPDDALARELGAMGLL